MSRLNSLGLTIFTVIVLETITGCTPLKMPKPNMWPFTTEDPAGMPTRVVTVWTDTVLFQPNQTPMRGFGGRLLFYSAEKPEPIKVEGTLTVYVFDETNRDPNNMRPDRKYVFTKEQLPSHYSKSKLGHSYSVWIPWDETGGPQKELSLIARFTSEKGGVVVGEQTKQILPGRTQIVAKNSGGGVSPSAVPPATPPQSPYAPNGSVQATSFVIPLPPVDAKMQGGEQNGLNQYHKLNVTTIQLPPQSSLKKPLGLGDMADPTMSNPVIPAPGVGSKYVTRTGVLNGAVPSMEANRPGCYPETTAVKTGIIPSNRESQSFSPPNRFAPGRPRAPFEPIARPNLDRGPWQPPPSGQAYFPETPQQPATVNGSPPFVVSTGTMQN